MRKKILCVAMTVVMAVGTLVGCGSSNTVTKKDKVESSIFTEITPGKSTREDLKKYYDNNGITYDADSCRMTNTGIFLGHEYYVDSTGGDDLRSYDIKIAFKDADDYKNGVSEIDDYFKSMSLGITAIVKDGDYTYHYFLVEDNDDYMTCLRYYPKTYEDNGDGYYNTIIKAGYYTFDQNTGDLDDIEWKDSKENKYTPKCIGNNTSSTED